MKKILYFLAAFFFISIYVFSQAPNSFKYQAVARNTSGIPIPSQIVKFKISILQGSESGASIFSEIHTTATNQFGLVNLEIGNGSSQVGSISGIAWGSDQYFMKLELDPTGGTNYQLLGTSQLLSVPYALYAESTGNTGNTGVPAGCIMPYVGTTAPTDYLICDGSAVSRTTYANLFAVIGTSFGAGDGTTTFNLPDFRGRFMRGIDGSAGNDPDNATRVASNAGGNTGNNIGSLQSDNYLSHSHGFLVNGSNTGSNYALSYNYLASAANGAQMWTSPSSITNTVSIQAAGGTETRPKNVYVNYIIKY